MGSSIERITEYRNTKAIGTDFEGYMFSSFFKKAKEYREKQGICGYYITDMRGSKSDINDGTDFMLDEIPIDATLNFNEKDHMAYSKPIDTKIPVTRTENFMMNIRTGNNHTTKNGNHIFENPVVVIGLSMPPSEFKQKEYAIMDSLDAHAIELLNRAEEEYYKYLDRQEAQKERQLPDISFESDDNDYSFDCLQ